MCCNGSEELWSFSLSMAEVNQHKRGAEFPGTIPEGKDYLEGNHHSQTSPLFEMIPH